jgi:hypothetical protein
MDCQNTDHKNIVGHTLLPIFYHVDPLNAQKQIGTFVEAFATHEERFHTETMNNWRGVLTKAGNCAGWNVDAIGIMLWTLNSCTFSSISCIFLSFSFLLNFRQKLIKKNSTKLN